MRQPNVLATLLVAVVTLLAAGPAGAKPRLEAEITTKMRAREFPPLFTPDGSLMIQTDGSRIAMWNAKNGRFIRDISNGVIMCRSAAVSPDGRRLATAGNCDRRFKRGEKEYPDGRYVLIWDLTAKHYERVIPIKNIDYVEYNAIC